MLTDSWVITGVVERGRQLGRTLGFPTANIALAGRPQPRTGVYAVRVILADGRKFDAVASVGCNPTVPKASPVLEVWIFDFAEDIYDQVLVSELVAYMREEKCFGSLDALSAQVRRDAAMARVVLARDRREGRPVARSGFVASPAQAGLV